MAPSEPQIGGTMRCTYPSRIRQCSGRLGQDSSGSASGLLLPGERVIGDAVALHGWRYESAEVTYDRSEEHTSELQSLMRISYAVLRLQKTQNSKTHNPITIIAEQ